MPSGIPENEKMKPLAIITSVSFEADQIRAFMKVARKSKVGNKTIYHGTLSARKVIIVEAGIGKVNAAHAATAVIENFSVDQIINSGIGGAYPRSGLTVGDVAIATKEIYGDEGVAGSGGWRGLREIGIPVIPKRGKRYFNEFPLDKKLVKLAVNESKKVFSDSSEVVTVLSGNFVTVSAVSGTAKRANELGKRFGALCENMEGAAISHICALYKVPLLEVRGISNIAGIRDKNRWDIKRASENCQRAVLRIMSRLN
jgi:futalosine hydrolase